jgi:penicillin-binding protein 2
MVSLPSYDNNVFSGQLSENKYQQYLSDPNQPLYNKVIAGGYTSGSIIKPLVASGALQEGVVDENTIIVDGGAISLPGGFVFRGWRPGGLGPMNVRSAIAWSSNIYFYTVGGGYGGIEGLGEERLTSYYRQFGLGEKTGIDLPNEIDGRVPDEEWKQQNKGEDWYVGDSYNISIGQGDLLISPLQINLAHAAIANDGYVLSPHLNQTQETVTKRELSVDKSNLQIVREGMRQVLTNGTTCDCLFSKVPATVAGKSGTAETNTPGGRRPHAWYSAFAPYEDPEIMVTILIEEGVGGSLYAAPAIAKTMEAYFQN